MRWRRERGRRERWRRRRRRRRRRLIVGQWRPLPGAAELPKLAEGGGDVDVVEAGELLSHQAEQGLRVCSHSPGSSTRPLCDLT